MHQIKYKLLSSDLHAPLYSHGIGGDKEVGVVKQRYLWPLHEQQEGELDEEHEGQLPYAADLQEHRAGQQRQQHTVAKILEQREGVRRSPGGTAEQLEALGITGFLYFFFFSSHLGEGAGGALAQTDLQTPIHGHIQAADQTGRHQRGGGVPLLGDALRQALGVTGKLGAERSRTQARLAKCG